MAKQYKLGINILGGADLNIPQHIELIGQIGWEAFFTGWDPNRTEAWANTAARNGLIYTSIHAPVTHVRYLWDEGEPGEQVTSELIECVRDCAAHKIPVTSPLIAQITYDVASEGGNNSPSRLTGLSL